MVVPRSGGRNAQADECAFISRTSQPFRRNAYRLAQFPLISTSRVFPPHPLQRTRRRSGKGQAAKERNGLHTPDGQGHFIQQRRKIFQLLKNIAEILHNNSLHILSAMMSIRKELRAESFCYSFLLSLYGTSNTPFVIS